MAKRRNYFAFSIGSLRQEVDNKVKQETFSQKIIADISKIDLLLLDNVSEDVTLFALLLKFGMAFFSSVAGAMEGLSVLPSHSRRQVFRSCCSPMPSKITWIFFLPASPGHLQRNGRFHAKVMKFTLCRPQVVVVRVVVTLQSLITRLWKRNIFK